MRKPNKKLCLLSYRSRKDKGLIYQDKISILANKLIMTFKTAKHFSKIKNKCIHIESYFLKI